ncbi:MAG: hypothetical protein IJ700_04815 [Bacteroidaceae bacterium]|nr:hypothetical protein [Bacteroidaceae bacterium]
MIRMGLTPHDINHNQHRRAAWRDYSVAGLYMITLCTEGRRPLFGELAGQMRAPRGSADAPHTRLSPLGQVIHDKELPKIHHTFPMVELWQAVIMPDHLHLLLYIREPLPPGKHLGHVIASFKGGCSRAWWTMTDPAAAQTAIQTAANAAGTPAAGTPATGTPATMPTAAVPTAAVPTAAVPAVSTAVPSSPAVSSSPAAVPSPRAPLFEAGYHDRIIKRPGQLETIKRYMADNPLRAVMRRELPHLLERRLHLRIGAHDYAAFGGLFLLKWPEKEQVFYHRKDKATGAPTETTEAFRRSRDRQLEDARDGVVLVSPAVSKGESLVINAAIDEGLPVIHLQKQPITRYWKPERRRFEACARGSLLILSPWGLDEQLQTDTPSDYARFHRLNDLAAEICATTDAVLLDISTYTPRPAGSL